MKLDRRCKPEEPRERRWGLVFGDEEEEGREGGAAGTGTSTRFKEEVFFWIQIIPVYYSRFSQIRFCFSFSCRLSLRKDD